MHRRTLLAAVPTAATVGSAGCLGTFDALGLADTTTRLGWFGVSNEDTEPHRFGLRVRRDGERIHQSIHAVDAKADDVVSSAIADCTWGDTAGEYVVATSVDDGDWERESLSKYVERMDRSVECVVASARYRPGELHFNLQPDCDSVPRYDDGCQFANE